MHARRGLGTSLPTYLSVFEYVYVTIHVLLIESRAMNMVRGGAIPTIGELSQYVMTGLRFTGSI